MVAEDKRIHKKVRDWPEVVLSKSKLFSPPDGSE